MSHVVALRQGLTGACRDSASRQRDLPARSRAREPVGYAEPVMLTEITRKFFGQLAEIWPNDVEKRAMIDLVSGDPKRTEAAPACCREFQCSMPCSGTVSQRQSLEGGKQFNVIPAAARAGAQRPDAARSFDRKVVNRLEHIVLEPGSDNRDHPSSERRPASDPGSEMFAAIAESAHDLDPKIAVVPYLSTGVGTAVRAPAPLGVKAYGVLPFPMVQSERGTHAWA